MPINIETVLPPPAIDILDVMDAPGYSGGTIASCLAYLRRGEYVSTISNVLSGVVLENISGWNFTVAFQGTRWCEATSAVATRKHMSTDRWYIPLGADQAALPASARQPMLYELECLTWRTTPLAASPLAFTIGYNGGSASVLQDPATNQQGYQVISDPAINAGRWTVQVRLVAGGAITTLVDTGIDPAVQPFAHLKIRYEHTTNPRLSCLVNGVEYGVLQGLANLPQQTTNTKQDLGLVQGLSVGGAAGQVDRMKQGRFRIQELPGFPT